jgi:hypothetical protein
MEKVWVNFFGGGAKTKTDVFFPTLWAVSVVSLQRSSLMLQNNLDLFAIGAHW